MIASSFGPTGTSYLSRNPVLTSTVSGSWNCSGITFTTASDRDTGLEPELVTRASFRLCSSCLSMHFPPDCSLVCLCYGSNIMQWRENVKGYFVFFWEEGYVGVVSRVLDSEQSEQPSTEEIRVPFEVEGV